MNEFAPLRHLEDGRRCSGSLFAGALCPREHHRPRHRRSGPITALESTSRTPKGYAGRHRMTQFEQFVRSLVTGGRR